MIGNCHIKVVKNVRVKPGQKVKVKSKKEFWMLVPGLPSEM